MRVRYPRVPVPIGKIAILSAHIGQHLRGLQVGRRGCPVAADGPSSGRPSFSSFPSPSHPSGHPWVRFAAVAHVVDSGSRRYRAEGAAQLASVPASGDCRCYHTGPKIQAIGDDASEGQRCYEKMVKTLPAEGGDATNGNR
jgi:hypothetical protein